MIMRIAVLGNLKENAPHEARMPDDRWDDLDSARTTDAIVAVLRRAGHEAQFFEAQIVPPFNLVARLLDYRPDLCFNISESHYGDAREAQIPGILEMLRIPYTGSKPLGLALALDKALTKRVLRQHGLPTAEFQLFEDAAEALNPEFLNEDGDLRYPLFVKPNAEGSSIGVTFDSIVRDVQTLRERVSGHLARYSQPVLVERFIKGREVLVGMVGNLTNSGTDGLTFMPISELNYAAYGSGHPGIYTNEMKMISAIEEYHYLCPAPLDAQQVAELHWLAAQTFRATGCKDFARVDFRLDENDGFRPYILEVNPLPGLNPGYSDLCLQALAMDWDHDRLIGSILDAALVRLGLRQREAVSL